MTNVLIAAGALGALGLLFGALLALVGQKFAVPEDPRKTAVRSKLPGANCGGCGFAGCDAYAEAVASGKAPVNKCPVGGDKVACELGEIMGVSFAPQERRTAVVMCRGDSEACPPRFTYDGPTTCKAASIAADGYKGCRYACLGFGDCEAHCPFGAIKVRKDGRAHVDPEKCSGCGVCVDACPRGVLKLLPAVHAVHRKCSAMERGRTVRDVCSAGCIGCGKCAATCKFGAIKMENHLPVIDLELCRGCMQCADKCPTGALKANEAYRRHALIRVDQCVGCDACKEVCRFDAIAGLPGQRHSIIDWNCVGCGKCVTACEHGCIRMVAGAKYLQYFTR